MGLYKFEFEFLMMAQRSSRSSLKKVVASHCSTSSPPSFSATDQSEREETGARGGLDPKTGEGQEKGTRGGFAKDQSDVQEAGSRGGLDQKTGESQETKNRDGFAKAQSEGQKTGARGGLGQKTGVGQ